ncbi:hypothetical protein SODALDRAFT_321405 [Sodiomyces alkalinus F11]|uniref:Zn(2)-C6 fungal-type domain-containing protein n=1 Tax=Sodiomyces alkalinus (strain CBS 110278 / VKM F-3762 / F11) TaxID=1314773 RepID=A0A3N2PKA1_SODAK|nr:hypothetical protein SODALDRAFT_321405 [Sodiomyces alkalinus F11]ROT34746.1 hypothetical protein SODALDRAFT_321405 [Sodiomyces alkalinus F11]
MDSGLPSPPMEEQKSQGSRKSSSSNSKSIKPHRHTSKRASPHSATVHHDQVAHGVSDGRHKRVWKACERCRMKKTKCDGEFPCKRCKDDGLVCTAGVRKKTEFKQLPRGYAEVLEHAQFALVATVHKLYAMVRSQQAWDLDEPELNDRGQPVVHDIAMKLGCIRPQFDADLPAHSVFPEDEAGMTALAHQLEEEEQQQQQQQQQQHQQHQQQPQHQQHPHQKEKERETETTESQSSCNLSDRASSTDMDHSEFETDYRKHVFFGGGGNDTAVTMSPRSFTGGCSDFDVDSVSSPSHVPAGMFRSQTSSAAAIPSSYGPHWTTTAAAAKPMTSPMNLAATQQFLQLQQSSDGLPDLDYLDLGLMAMESDEFGTIKPHMLSCPNPEALMGMGDPMIYSGFDPESIRL